jgi:rod shape-determining protein MreB
MAQNIYGVDIGTSNLKMCCNEKGRILNEKNIIAIANKKEMLAFGDEAYDMYEKAPENIEVSFPVKFGVIADIENMQTLLVSFFNKINDDKKFSGNTDFYIAVPTDVTEVEKRAFYELVADSKVKAKNIYIVDKPVADAIGAGLDVTKSKGIMVVNIGAETTEISVISLGGIVISKSIKIGGNKLDDSIISIIRKEYNLVIGSKTAEGLKKELGSAVKAEEKFAPGFGRNVLSGLPVSVQISSDVIYSAIVDPLHSIMDSIKVILERTPPELAADIIKDGIYVTGGTSNISNLQQFINKETNLNVNIVENPAESVVRGLIDVVNKPEFSKIPYTPQDKKYE